MGQLWLYNPSGFYTACADPYSLGLAVLNGADPLQVRIPSGFRLIMGMTDIIAYNRLFTAYFTDF